VRSNDKTILVVDDASLVRLFYRSTLEQAGFRVMEAINGLEAIEKLLVTPADMLIIDINMPQMDGFSFLDVLRRKELPLCAIPALIASTESRQTDFDAARTAGANFYLVKPVDRDLLVRFARMFCGISA
jgi:two-component system chemotaxis response regulator CheY